MNKETKKDIKEVLIAFVITILFLFILIKIIAFVFNKLLQIGTPHG